MNRNNIKNEVEKSLKRFLKDKLKITASLLVGFLISGELSFGSSSADLASQITVSQEDLLNKIAIEKSEIQALIDANEARLKELGKNEFELLRKGNFYSKSIYESSQVLFPLIIENSGKMKNKTKNQFEQTFDDAKKYYAGNGYILNTSGEIAGKNPIPGLTLEEAVGLSYDEQIELLLIKGQGVLPKINTPDIISIDLGVNIQLLTPEIPIININAEVSTPTVSFPILSIPSIPNVTAPVTPTIPSTISVTVEAPTPIAGVNVVEPIITEPQIPQERDLTVATPQAPGAFDPLMIIPPDPPSTPVVNIPNTPAIEIHVVSSGNGYAVYVDNPNGDNSVISHVGVTAGEFYIKRNDNGTFGAGAYNDNYWEYKYDNYDVINIGSDSAYGDIALAAPSSGTFYTLTGLTTSGAYKLSNQYQRGFMRQLEQYPTYTNAKFVVSRATEDSGAETDEFVHMDMHGGTSAQNVADRLLEATTISGKSIEVSDAWNDIITNLQDISDQSTYSVIVNSGSIYLEGGNLSLNNMYDHTGYGKNIFMNTGNVILQPYNDAGTIYGGQNAVFVISTDLSGTPHDIMYNGETGNIDVYTKDSVGYIIDSGYNSSSIYVYLYDYSNKVWSTGELNQVVQYTRDDDPYANYWYPSESNLIPWGYMQSPYQGGSYGSNPVYSTVNRGNLNMYGAGSAGIYLKNAGGGNSPYYSKDTRGEVTITYTMVELDCSSGSYNSTTYPLYGFPVLSTRTVQKTYNPSGYPDDFTSFSDNGIVDIQFVKEDGTTPAPIKIYGDRSVGLYLGDSSATPKTVTLYEYDASTWAGSVIDTFTTTGGVGNVTGKLYVDLGDSLGSGNKTYTSNPANTQGNPITNDPLGNTNLDTIDGSAGIISGSRINLDEHGIRIFDGNKASMGIGVINNAVLNIGQGYINVLGGEDNLGIMIDEGTVNSQGEINILGGTGSMGVLQSSGNSGTANIATINVGDTGNTVNGAVGLFAVNAGTELTSAGKINVYGNNYGVFAIDDGKIILNKASLTGTRTNPDMYVSGGIILGKPTGVGLLTARNTAGGTIEARNYYVTAVDSNAGVASLGTGSLIDLQGSVVDYSGSGYAVYSDGAGIVDMTNNGEIKLRSGTALEMDLSIPPTVLFDATSKITVLSNDAVVINLKNVMGGLQTSTLRSDIVSYLGGVNIIDGVEFAITYDKYKIAAVDGGNFTIDTALDKADTNTSSDSFFYFRRFLAQRMNMNVLQNVNSTITNQYSVDYFKGQVTGLELSSSPLATSRADTSINIAATATVTADRTDAGNGGIGIYINYGNVINAGNIKVETGANIVNEGGIGIYAVNGAYAQNTGTVETAGKNGVGLYGTSYRLATNDDLVPMEFGAALTDQGKTRLENTGTIKTTGEESIGIYGLNNSADSSLPPLTPTHQMNIINTATGIIDVSAGNKSVGMYGEGDVIINNSGIIKVGQEGAGIYSGDDSQIANLGTINLGKDAIGVILEGTGIITATGTYTPTGTWVTGEKGKIGIVIKGKVAGVVDITPKTLSTDINASGLDHGIALYIKDKGNIVSNGNIDVGNIGVGIYLDNGNVVNNGTIDLGSSASASGMYSVKGVLSNNGTINVDTNGQIGMIASGDSASISNIGTINLNASNSSAIYINDEAAISLTSTPNIVFTGNKNFGIYADKGIVNIGAALNVALPNSQENIYVYATDGSTINHTTGNITVNGGVPAGASKTIGIYLKNSGSVQNIYTSTGGTISVQGGAIGIYSKNGNRMETTQVDATGDKTVGIYIENGGILKGKVTASGASSSESVVGVYENAGTLMIDTLLSLEVGAGNTSGLGMYLENGASVTGSSITIENKNTIKTNVGIYYTGNYTLSHGTDITLLGNKVVGIYADNSMKLSNNKTFTYTAGATEQVAAYISGNATYDNTGNINITANDSAGIYVVKGLGKNTGTISVGGANSAALMAQGKIGADTATVENAGTITVNSGAGIVIGDTSSGGGVLGISKGKNTGTINLTPGTTGVAISGNDNSNFDGNTGTINVSGTLGNTSTGLMMLGTISGQVINAGNIVLGDSNSIAIYAKDSIIDFGVNILGTNEGTGVFADGLSTISGNINASSSNGVIALYINSSSILLNGATITTGTSKTLGSSGVGIYFDSNYTLSNTIVQTTGDGIGIVVGAGRTLNYIGGAKVNVGNGGTGIYVGGAGSILNADGGEINITNNGIGINVGIGGTANVGVSGPININFTGTGGIAVVSATGGTVNLGNNIIITGFGTMASTIDGSLTNNGNIIINNGALGLQGYFTTGGSLLNGTGASITVNAGGIGMAASGAGTVTVTNDGTITVSGDNAVGMASELGTISNLNGTMTITNNGLGIYASGSANISALGLMTVSGGIGFVADGIAITPSGTITLQNGTSDNYSIGGYFIDVGSLPTTYTVNQNANYTIGNVIEGAGTAVNVSTINQVGGVYNHQIALNTVGELGNNLSVSLGTAVNVSDYLGNAGESNIGINAKYTDINLGVNGVIVGDSVASADMSKASVGVYLENGSLVTTGNISAGRYSIGILGENITGISVGGIDVGDRGTGIDVEGDGSSGATIVGDFITTGNDESVGVYAKNINTTITGGMTVGQLSSLGIVNEGRGNITVDGSINVAGVANIDNEEGSIAIYKEGPLGDINVGHNTPTTMNIGREGYGIYAIRNTGVPGTMTIDNRADINLGTSAVGIYGSGAIDIDNSGNLVVGDTYLGSGGDHNATEDHRNSVGIYLDNGASLINRGNIDVSHDHSVGIYGNGTGIDIRLASGTMTVDNGGIGILAKGGAMVTIEAGASMIVKVTNPTLCLNTSTGVAVYAGSQVTNRGSITVDDGIGILVSPGTSFINEGTLIINNGVGINGAGSFIQGPGSNITVNGGVLALAVGEEEDKTKGSVTIAKDGTIEINNNYFAIGGTFDASDTRIRLNGAYVGIEALTNAKIPLFKAEMVEGNINLLPDFAKSGNGYEWTIMDFAKALGAALTEAGATSRVGVSTSPLFVKKEVIISGQEALRIAKVPYGDLVIEEQFQDLYDGLDNILYNGEKGADVLKNFNAYLEEIYNKDSKKFDDELIKGLSETRGDIYSTIQKRMQNVQSAIDSSWEELEKQYNVSKDSDKYSIIYKHGDYKNPTMGIDDYEYTTYGAIYMKEYEGKNYANKYGYSIGFAVSKFRFDDDYKFDNKSKEDIYSLRVGMHNVKSLIRADGNDKLRLITRLELGYNRHESSRVIELDKIYRTKGKYNTYNVTLDNKLEYNVSRSHNHSLDIYGALNAEYSKIGGFSEKSSDGLELEIKKNDNLSVEAEVGIQGHKRVLVGKKVSAKLEGKVAYAYEFGNSNEVNRARLAKGGSDYYKLIEPEKEKGTIKGRVGVTFENANKAGVTFEVEARKHSNKKDVDISYGVRFKYVF